MRCEQALASVYVLYINFSLVGVYNTEAAAEKALEFNRISNKNYSGSAVVRYDKA